MENVKMGRKDYFTW